MREITKNNGVVAPWCWQEKSVLRSVNMFYEENPAAKPAKPYTLAIYLALTWTASDRQNERFTAGIKRLSARAGCSERTASKALTLLMTLGIIDIRPRFDPRNNRQFTSEYELYNAERDSAVSCPDAYNIQRLQTVSRYNRPEGLTRSLKYPPASGSPPRLSGVSSGGVNQVRAPLESGAPLIEESIELEFISNNQKFYSRSWIGEAEATRAAGANGEESKWIGERKYFSSFRSGSPASGNPAFDSPESVSTVGHKNFGWPVAKGDNAGPKKSPEKPAEKFHDKFGDGDKRDEQDKLFAKLRKNVYHNSLMEVFDNLTGIKHGGDLLSELIQKAMSTVLVNCDGYLRWNYVYDHHTLDIYALAAKATRATAQSPEFPLGLPPGGLPLGGLPPNELPSVRIPNGREQAAKIAGDIAAAALAEWFLKRPRRAGPTYYKRTKKRRGSNDFDQGSGPFRPRRAASGNI